MSLEAFVLLPWYREIFTEDELVTAERRLTEHRFEVERFIRDAARQIPAWAQRDDDAGFEIADHS